MSENLIRDLEALTDLFKIGGWSELRVEAGGLSVLFATNPTTAGLEDGEQASLVEPIVSNEAVAKMAPPGVSQKASPDAIEPGWLAVTAPNLGTFYRSAKPGSPPFVEVGDRVTAETEICLVEVMKLFTSVKAGVAGIIRRIDAADAELVEGGQTLFHIEPE